MIRNLYALIIFKSNHPSMKEGVTERSITPQQLQQRYERYGSS